MTPVKIYIAGPMTGLPEYNLPAFAAAAVELESLGYEVTNPGRHGVIEGFTWQDYVRRGLIELLACDAIALLDGWESSRGAKLEVQVAETLFGYEMVRPIEEWIAMRAVA